MTGLFVIIGNVRWSSLGQARLAITGEDLVSTNMCCAALRGRITHGA